MFPYWLLETGVFFFISITENGENTKKDVKDLKNVGFFFNKFLNGDQ